MVVKSRLDCILESVRAGIARAKARRMRKISAQMRKDSWNNSVSYDTLMEYRRNKRLFGKKPLGY